MRALWSGEIAFGLVTIPSKLYSATRDLTPSFNQLHKECGTRIQMARRCPKCNRDVEWGEIGKGREVAKGEYVLFTKEELAAIEGSEGSGGIDIVQFIDPLEVDFAYFEKSYWVGPGGKSARGFELLRETLEKTKKAALARVKIRTRTQLGLLRPRDNLFALDMMRFADELVSGEEIVIPETREASGREIDLALDLVKQLEAPFDASKLPNEYRAAVDAATQEKVDRGEAVRDSTSDTGEEEAPAAKGGGAKVIDLAELLKRSLANKSAASLSAPHKPKKSEAPP
ncbi:MAG: Ku protein, partial [Polyangiaceae bacterium]